MAAVAAKDIKKQFDEVTAVNGVSLEARDGEFMVLLGPSGCGKTTLLRIIAGLEKQTSGDVVIGGHVVNDLPPRARGIAMVFQSYGLYPHLSVWNNIAFPLKTQGTAREEIKRKVEWSARLLGIERLLQRRPRQLSGGERQRVALARAFLANAPILILDEATSSLDSESEALIQDAMHSLMRGRTTLVIAHRLSTVRELDRILVFDHGRIIEDGNHAVLLRLKGGIYRRLVERQAEGLGDALAA